MTQKTRDFQVTPLDISDVQRWVGRPLAGAQLKEPIARGDIRRWVQGMQNPNRLYYDEQFAAQGAFGELIAPQSFLVCCTVGLGAVPGMQGNVPGVHMLLGGDEYWFYGPRVKPGDRIRTDTMLFDYRVTETKFGGPTLFSRGDTSFFNQHGVAIGKLRSSSIRYNPETPAGSIRLGDKKASRNGPTRPSRGWKRKNSIIAGLSKDTYCATSIRCKSAKTCPCGRSDRIRSKASPPSGVRSCSPSGARRAK
jgi:acyl dehydratase